MAISQYTFRNLLSLAPLLLFSAPPIHASHSDDFEEEKIAQSSHNQRVRPSGYATRPMSVTDEEKKEAPAFELPPNLRAMKIFPSPYEYAILGKHAYRDDVSEGDKVEVSHNHKLYKLHEWEVYKFFSYDEKSTLGKIWKRLGGYHGGYRGTLYRHRRKKQMVLAHRGTDPKNASALKTDALSIVLNKIGGQETLTLGLVKEAFAVALKEGCDSLSFTGHSLGGWLAQVSLYVFFEHAAVRAFNPNLYSKIYTKAVTFDTPGAYKMLDKMNAAIGGTVSIEEDLDITNYLSLSNWVNWCNKHAGSCYQVIFDSNLKGPIAKHTIDNFLEAFNPNIGSAKKCYLVTKLGKIEYEKNTAPLYDGEEIPTDSFERYNSKKTRALFRSEILHQRHLPRWFKELITQGGHKKATPIVSFYGFREDFFDGRVYRLNDGVDYRLFLDGLMNKGKAWVEKFFEEKLAPSDNPSFQACDPTGKTNFDKSLPSSEHLLKRKEELLALHKGFIGKEKEEEEKEQEESHTSQVILGPGGMGKSTLARLYIEEYFKERGYYTHAWWLDAEDKTALANSIDDITQKMGIPTANDYLNPKQKWEKIQQKLAEYPGWLLVFDNAKNPTQLLDYFPKCKEGHILITSRHRKPEEWQKAQIRPYELEEVSPSLSEEFLEGFRKSVGTFEKSEKKRLLTAIDKRLPFTLSLIGHCIKEAPSLRNNPYKKYLKLYKQKKAAITSQKDLLEKEGVEDIAIAFAITAEKMQEAMKNTNNPETAKEAWRLLRVMAFLHPDGLDWTFFHYLRPSLQGKWFKGWSNNRDKVIKAAKAHKAARYLCKYGLLIDEGEKSRAHRTIQAIMRFRIAQKAITQHIQDQALQLLETMQAKTPDKVAELHHAMMCHCCTLMGYIEKNARKRTRLLCLVSNVEGRAYYKGEDLYLPPQAVPSGDLHKQVITFVNGTHSNFSKRVKWLSITPIPLYYSYKVTQGQGKAPTPATSQTHFGTSTITAKHRHTSPSLSPFPPSVQKVFPGIWSSKPSYGKALAIRLLKICAKRPNQMNNPWSLSSMVSMKSKEAPTSSSAAASSTGASPIPSSSSPAEAPTSKKPTESGKMKSGFTMATRKRANPPNS